MDPASRYHEVDRRGFGPFTTVRVYRRPDGSTVESLAWHRRKGHGLIDPDDASSYPVHWWAPGRRGWWIALLFMVGSTCFAVGAFPPTAAALGANAGYVFFIGSLFFTSAAYLQFYEAVNEGLDVEGRERTRKLFGLRTSSPGWWATAVQLVGTLAFNVSTFTALGTLSAWQEELLVWAPDAIGSVCFLVASGLVVAETHDRLRGTRLRSLESRIAAINMLGSIAFGISAIGAFVVPSTGELLSLPLVNLTTFIGAVCFFVGAALLIPAMRPEPRTGASAA
jgi:hypothetical protein